MVLETSGEKIGRTIGRCGLRATILHGVTKEFPKD
jgi:hypothetical protein